MKNLAWAATALAAATGSAHAECQYDRLVKLPVTMEGMRASIPVSINGRETDLWISTGSFFNIMAQAKTTEFGLKLQPATPDFYISGVGGSAEAHIAMAKNVKLAGMSFPEMDFVVGGSDAGNGWIGANLFYPFDTEFDLAHGQISLMRGKGCDKTNLAYWAGDRFVARTRLAPGDRDKDPHIYTYVIVNGVKLKAMFDTGTSNSSLMRSAALRAGIDMTRPDVIASGSVTGIGIKARKRWVVKLDSFEIGDEAIRHSPIEVIDENNTGSDMILGMDFFLSHHLMVSRSQNQIYITYNGGPVFSLGTGHEMGKFTTREEGMGGADKEAEPADAAGFARRGSARLARQDYAGAIADLSEAISRAPDQGDYLRERARAYAGNKQPELAASDQAAAARLLPDDPKLLVAQARAALQKDDRDTALALADKAAELTPRGSLDNRPLVGLYERLHQPERSLALIEEMIALHKDDHALGELLNARCYDRGLANIDLDKAMKDCEAAIRRDGELPTILDSRALIHLRQKDYAAAMADYDKVIKTIPTARYLRGLARIGAGQKAEGEADIAAARQQAPARVAELAGYGLTPP